MKPIIALLSVLQIVPALSSADELGRLFFTRQQRAQLEQGQTPNSDRVATRRELSVNGIVQKHGGQRTVWIDGVAQAAGNSDEQSPESLPVAIPGQDKPVKVKVGQRVLLNPGPGTPDIPTRSSPNQNSPKQGAPGTAKRRTSDED
ncbi:MAG: hypothetical protein HYZ46_02505 [Nitrosomonadales bacterium]|nr:hypothetical protein [Nitrosomonadales bacterium]